LVAALVVALTFPGGQSSPGEKSPAESAPVEKNAWMVQPLAWSPKPIHNVAPRKPATVSQLKPDPSQASIVSLAQQQKAKAEVRAARHRRFLTQKQAHAKARHRRYLREQKAHARARHKRWRAEKRCWGRHGKWIKGACKLPSPPVSSPQASAPTQTYTPPSKQPAPTQTKPANPGPSSGCRFKYCPDPAGPSPPAPKPPGPDKYPGSTGRSASALTGGTDSTLASAGTGGASGPDEG
jgi:hypothetical protein